MRFVPDDLSRLDAIFLAMNECQALYPDSEMSGDEDEEEEGDRYDRIGYDFMDAANPDEEDVLDPKYYTADTDPNDIVLSAKGQEILNRLNINFESQSI